MLVEISARLLHCSIVAILAAVSISESQTRSRAYQEFVAYRVINNATVQWRLSGQLHTERGFTLWGSLLNRGRGKHGSITRAELPASKRGLRPSER